MVAARHSLSGTLISVSRRVLVFASFPFRASFRAPRLTRVTDRAKCREEQSHLLTDMVSFWADGAITKTPTRTEEKTSRRDFHDVSHRRQALGSRASLSHPRSMADHRTQHLLGTNLDRPHRLASRVCSQQPRKSKALDPPRHRSKRCQGAGLWSHYVRRGITVSLSFRAQHGVRGAREWRVDRLTERQVRQTGQGTGKEKEALDPAFA